MNERIKLLLSTPPPPNPNPNPKYSTVPPRRSLPLGDGADAAHGGAWEPLPLPRSELSLPLTLPTGQTFRWRRTSPGLFTGVVGPHLVSLSHPSDDPRGGVAFLLHGGGGGAPSASAAARAAVADYLNVGVSLAELWSGFAAADPRFAELAETLGGGARVLRQDPVECLFQFLCSSNNNIGRIEKMVGVLSSFGNYLGSVGGFDFHEFPSIDRLSLVSESELRETGFGYSLDSVHTTLLVGSSEVLFLHIGSTFAALIVAKYIVGTAKALSAKPGGGAEWLTSLRRLDLNEVIDALCTLPGVGPKVAACVALFSLDQHHAIPVDTHVWQIATRYFVPELAGKSLTPKLCSRVADAFVTKFGNYAGWAQNVLFIGELSSRKVITSSANNNTAGTKESTKRKRGRNKIVVTEALCGE